MKFKGFEIVPVYSVCADWKLDKNNCVVSCRRKSSDIEYYRIIDNGRDWIAEFTIDQCKKTITDFLTKAGLKKNTID